jgi:hypothetical protein
MTVTTDHDLTERSDVSQSRRYATHLHQTKLKPACLRVIITSGVLLFLAGCSDSPSEPGALAVLEQKIQRQSNGLIKFVSFHETKGMADGIWGGMKVYKFEYTAAIEFTDDCIWTSGGTGGWQGEFDAMRTHGRGGLEGRQNISSGMQPAKKGQRQRVSGLLYCVKTENGWGISD